MALFDGVPSPADNWDRDVARRALDDLFSHTRQYRSSKDYHDLIRFIARFRFYSPFNAMLIHVQMPGATFVAPPHRWLREYRRRIKAGARPLVILQPKGPVMFVFDVSDTEGEEGSPPLPYGVTHPFEVRHGTIGGELKISIRNAVRDGVDVAERQAGSQSAGEIRTVDAGRYLKFQTAVRPEPKYARIPRRYEVLLNAKHSPEARYATLAHELAHLYCGHLGTPTNSGGRRGPNSPGKKRSRPNQPPTSSPAATTPPFSSPPTFTNTWNRTGRSRPPRRSPPDIGTVKSAAPFRRVRSSKR